MKPLLKSILPLAILITSCGATQTRLDETTTNLVKPWDLPIRVQRLSSLDDRLASEWQIYFEREIIEFVDSPEDADCTTEFVDFSGSSTIGHTTIGAQQADNDIPQTCEILIQENLSDKSYIGTLSHEIGHALGANHMSSGLMYYKAQPYEELSDLFVGEFEGWMDENYFRTTL